MRVTAETRIATRERIIEAARTLFGEKGFDQTTTRDIASAAKIAAGTLFNYFPTKEAVATTIVADALEQGQSDFEARRRDGMSIEEGLFGFILSGLKRLAPLRHYVGSVVETTLSPFARSSQCSSADDIRVRHLEVVADLLSIHPSAPEPSFVTAHLYWSLYLGVLAFWSTDVSENQEDTLVLLDQATRVFVSSVFESTNSTQSVQTGVAE